MRACDALREEPNATPYALLALLLLPLPLLFTFAKLVALAAQGERSHQFVAEPVRSNHNLYSA